MFKVEASSSSGSGGFKPAFPTPCSVREALSCFVDLGGLPRRTSLKDWAPFARDPVERARLLLLASKEGKALFKAEVEDRKRSLLEILTVDLASVRVPLDHLLHKAPSLQPRYYTISSSSSKHPKRIHLTVSVITEAKPDQGAGKPAGVFEGVCSSQLARLLTPATDPGSGRRVDEEKTQGGVMKRKVGAEKTGQPRPARPWPSCRVFVRPSSFRLPSDPAVPIVMVGPGTGIAPMRALLQERSHQRNSNAKAGSKVGPSVLYFGCKDEKCDYLYADELKKFQDEGTLTALHIAFSRPGFNHTAKKGTPSSAGAGAAKVYVQHLMREAGKRAELWELIHGRGAHVYVCGGTSMGSDVGRALLEVVQHEGGQSVGDADKYVATLKAQGRYVQELWA